MNERLKFLREKAMQLPLTPGVYIMKNKQNDIIYIGKAKALKNRVSQYFGGQQQLIKVQRMIDNVYDFDYILTDSEFEALILECSLIKQHHPKYNILLKDDKGYHYIRISSDEYRKITAVKKKPNDNAEYIGPYTNSFTVTQSVDEALKIFKLPQCNKVFPRDIGKGRPCLNFFISQCAAPCSGHMSKEEYSEAVNDAISFLKGGSTVSVKEMQKRMLELSENLEFEKAARLRDRINAINKMNERQKVVSNNIKEQDVFAVVQDNENACCVVLRFSKGRLYDSEHFLIEVEENLPKTRSELLKRYYSMREKIPPRVTLDGEIEDIELLSSWLSEKSGRKVLITIPQRGDQLKLVEMCRTNASEKLSENTGRSGRQVQSLDELARLLGLSHVPEYIEAYDISHTAGADSVAGMVAFKNGLPYKSAYKRFAIKEAQGGDDCACLAEVLSRRFNRYLEQKETNEGFGRLPDLILIDGGQGQINAAAGVLKEFSLGIPMFGMVKDDKHRTRAIASNGGEISINENRQAFTLVSKIQEEVHRFSIDYHHSKHGKKVKSSILTEINGIGQTKANLILKHFKTMQAIKDASVNDLTNVKGISFTNAEEVYNFFHKN